MAVTCAYCGRSVLASVMGEGDSSPQPQDGLPRRSRLLRCRRTCETSMLLQEDYGYGLGYDEDGAYRLYPHQRRIVSGDVPTPLREEFNQALQCFEAKAYTAAAVMVGRTLEGVCADQGVREKTLHRALKVMS